MAEDIQLLRQYAETRAEAAFTALVERHLPLVYSAALRQLGGVTHRAEDVAQSVFTDLARKAAAVSRRDDIVGWLYTSTHYAAAKLKRAEARRQQREQEAQTMQQFLSGATSNADWDRMRPVIDDAMHELSDPDRQAILLRFFRDERFAEIARQLGTSENGARMRVERALDKLHALLAKRGITSTTAALGILLANQTVATAPAGLAAAIANAALSAGATGGGAVLTLWGIMNNTKLAVGVAATFGALAVGTTTYHHHLRPAAAAKVAAARHEQAVHVARLSSLQERTRTAEQTAVDLKQKIAAAEAKGAADAEAAKAQTDRALAEGNSFLQRHPEVAQALRDEVAAYASLVVARMSAHLRVTPDQVQALQSLLANVKLSRSNSGYSRRTGDGKVMRLAVPPDEQLSPQDVPARLRALLGDEGVSAFDRFAGPVAYEAERAALRVSNDLCFTDTPLTPQQAAQLTEAMRTTFAGKLRNEETRKTIDWAAIETQAREVLTPAQWSGWETAFTRTRVAVTHNISADGMP